MADMKTANDAPDIKAALTKLKQDFAKKIPAKIEEIRQSWEVLKINPESEDYYNQLHLQSHSLAGTAATYGFEEIGRCARIFETTLQEVMADVSAAPIDIGIKNIEALLVQLEAVALLKAEINEPHLELWPRLPESSTGDSKLIYLVDDDADFLETMSIQIQTFGYQVKSFLNLATFRQAIKKQAPEIVVMDVLFGEDSISGIEQVAKINAEREQPLQCIFITGSHDVLTRLDAVRANGLAYFTKPVVVGDLVDALDRLTHQVVEEPFKIIIVDDSKDITDHVSLTLQQAGMETRSVNDPLQLLHVLSEFSPDLILMDIYMPGCNGLELSKVVRQMDDYVSIPIVFLSSEHDLKKQLGAMSLGGDDFLTKPIEPWHLVVAVSSRVERGRMIRKLADTDGLTGLINHSKSKERLDIEVARARREKTDLSYAMLDIDHFKHVNDTYGHPAGDRVLKSLANMFKQRLRQIDIIGRYGGEEFVVIFPNTDTKTVQHIMDELRTSFNKISHVSDNEDFYCSFSCGIASFPEINNSTALNDAADKALYAAKDAGRNRVCVA